MLSHFTELCGIAGQVYPLDQLPEVLLQLLSRVLDQLPQLMGNELQSVREHVASLMVRVCSYLLEESQSVGGDALKEVKKKAQVI